MTTAEQQKWWCQADLIVLLPEATRENGYTNNDTAMAGITNEIDCERTAYFCRIIYSITKMLLVLIICKEP